MLKLKKIVCTTLAATALFTGSAITSAVNSDKGTASPFISIEADASGWGEYYIKGWKPVRKSPNNTAPLIGAYRDNYVYGYYDSSTGYIKVTYWTMETGYVKRY